MIDARGNTHSAATRSASAPDTVTSMTRGDRKALCQLLRALICGATIEGASPSAASACEGRQGQAQPPSMRIVKIALSLGLVQEGPAGLVARREATSFLRRAKTLGDADGPATGRCDGPETPTEAAFTSQHREIVSDTVLLGVARQPVRRNLADQPLAGLARLKDRSGAAFLPQGAVEAGERLARDFDRGQLQPRVTSRWEPQLEMRGRGERGGMADLTDVAAAARRRVGEAADAMGPELAGVALDICCFGKGLELVERERGWPARSAKLMLRTALMALARHYAPPASKRRAVHRWSDREPSTGIAP